MTHQIDASFRQRKQSFAAWRRRGRLRRLGLGAGAIVVLAMAAGAYSVSGWWITEDDLDEELQATELAGLPEDAPAYIPAIVDLAGDPLWITLGRDPTSQSKVKLIDRPADLDGPFPTKLEVLSDEMLSSSEQFMTTIPSSQEDFAFFQAQRGGGIPAGDMDAVPTDDHSDLDGDLPAAPVSPTAGAGETVDDVGAGWDELAEVEQAGPTQFQKTQIEDTTTVATVVPESNRYEPTEDTFVRILGTRALESVVTEAGFEAAEAKLATDALASVFNRTQLEEGYVVAMRGFRAQRGARPSLMQVSVYTKNAYVGTLVRNETGGMEAGVDPWVGNDLFNYSGLAVATGERQYRLLDAIYSTGVRNSVPASVVGEAIVHLSRTNDLNLFADKSDRLTLIYSQEARGAGDSAGRVLYVAVQGSGRSLECYVFQQTDGSFGCAGEAVSRSAAASTGMSTPVNGVLTSTFGPRKHPILKTVRLHKGVDWKAPTGTPIVAAFDGEIAYRGDGKGYGNLIRMTHAGGRETRYAHMQRFADDVGLGATVKAGTVIGYVGTTGLSTGPHLHFEVYVNGEPVDPLGNLMVAVAAVAAPEVVVPAIAMSSDEQAVETLTNRIIHVESGGRANAKNPLSSATGLGQFISSTWLRMMRTYRPDLARSMSEKDLLALRFDPTISREMVKNLAREGEAYLKGRGHFITAGRLYLCHFLGMEGAHIVLAAPRSDALVSLLGAGVIRANPFLTGKDAGYVIDWAERKMRSHKGTAVVTTSPSTPSPAPPVVVQLSPEFEKYRTSIGGILKTIAPAT